MGVVMVVMAVMVEGGRTAAYVFEPQAGEHLAECVRRVARLAQARAEGGAAVGLAVGPAPLARGGDEHAVDRMPDEGAAITVERAKGALRWARAGEVVLAWGSQAYLSGEFASVTGGFVRLARLL